MVPSCSPIPHRRFRLHSDDASHCYSACELSAHPNSPTSISILHSVHPSEHLPGKNCSLPKCLCLSAKGQACLGSVLSDLCAKSASWAGALAVVSFWSLLDMSCCKAAAGGSHKRRIHACIAVAQAAGKARSTAPLLPSKGRRDSKQASRGGARRPGHCRGSCC